MSKPKEHYFTVKDDSPGTIVWSIPAPHPFKDPDAQSQAAPRMAEAGQILSRLMLDNIHAKVRKAFPKVAKSVWRAATVEVIDHPDIGLYRVTIKVPGMESFSYEGHAVNEYHARLTAWTGFLEKHLVTGERTR